MKTAFVIIVLLSLQVQVQASQCDGILNHEFKTLNGKKMVNLCKEYKGQVLLIVNTASKCAYTDQYAGLEALYRRYKAQGLVVLGFPSNDFGHQEPGTEKQIQQFCRLTYGVEFPMFAKTSVKQGKAHPFYKQLAKQSGSYPRWNFHKYLIGADGKFIAAYESSVKPMSDTIRTEIEKQLKSKS